ncbi:hypothetical protein JKF63_07292 [Porcisia hertigi]|uniref:COPI associated protein n=1 Tax=Porcisia hertigi TaxID=2761500 RepID=A0A836YGC7_9TRYP|nr:hypothetical protein JKF63_07292 [Porcisia hertigi]
MVSSNSVAPPEPVRGSCCQHNWPLVFLITSFIVTLFAFVGIILGFVKIIFAPNIVLLNVYCLIFCLLGLSAELRQFSLFRRVVYTWMKYFYFLVHYRQRGIFYIFFGFLLIGTGAIEIISGALAIALGALMLVVSTVVSLPKFEDPEEERRVREEYQFYYGGGGGDASTGAAPAPSSPAANIGVPGDTSTVPATTNKNQPQTVAKPPRALPAAAAAAAPAVASSSGGANLYREYNFGESVAREEEEEEAFSYAGSHANPYENEYVFQNSDAKTLTSLKDSSAP